MKAINVIVLSGLSESGKSTVGEILRTDHGFCRLKIGWLLETAALRASISHVYDTWDELEQAAGIVSEIRSFANANRVTNISIESAHSAVQCREIKSLLDGSCTVIWVEAQELSRASREGMSLEELRAKDLIKLQRGVIHIKEFADIIINNDQSLWYLREVIAAAATARNIEEKQIETDPTTLALPHQLTTWLCNSMPIIISESTQFVIITGSAVGGDWKAGWSDLDLLIVDDSPEHAIFRIRALRNSLIGITTKIGFTVVTTAEIKSLRLSARVTHVLRGLPSTGAILFSRSGALLVRPDMELDKRRSAADLPNVVAVLRRLLMEECLDIRAIHKHVVLVAKIILKLNDIHMTNADSTWLKFMEQHQPHLVLPRVAEMEESGELKENTIKSAAFGILKYYESMLDNAYQLNKGFNR